MTTLRFVLGDQLSREVSALRGAVPGRDVVLMAEVAAEATYVRHHKQKIVFVFSAMRAFADGLRAEGFEVRYARLDDPETTGSFASELVRAVAKVQPRRIIVTEPGEWRVRKDMDGWDRLTGVPVEIRSDDRFYCSIEEHRDWSDGRKAPRLDHFYRYMRRKTGVLMAGDDPVGGRWNLDADNRNPMPKDVRPPPARRFEPDANVRTVIELVNARFADHFGSLDTFGWATTREQALIALDWFIDHALPDFGRWQDAMRSRDSVLFHSALSPYLNVGLLTPREVVARAEAALSEGRAPLNSVEGFIRQIIGWREYVRGVYWLRMPDYAASNALEASAPLPDFYWTGKTSMACVHDVVTKTEAYAYAHHIERLMVLGNLALLLGVRPTEIEEWFLIVYADAFEWVELPNVHGMAIHADGGVLGSKPYAASGAYINRMSNYCRDCAFDSKQRTGERACPFTTLYWDFLMRHEARFSANPRMAIPLKALSSITPDERKAIRARAAALISGEATVSGGPRTLL